MKVIMILTASVLIVGSIPGIALSNSRLNGIDCGPRMSRLDADKCEQIKRSKAKRAKSSEQSYSKRQSNNYDDGYDDAFTGDVEWGNSDEYLDGYEEGQRQRKRNNN